MIVRVFIGFLILFLSTQVWPSVKLVNLDGTWLLDEIYCTDQDQKTSHLLNEIKNRFGNIHVIQIKGDQLISLFYDQRCGVEAINYSLFLNKNGENLKGIYSEVKVFDSNETICQRALGEDQANLPLFIEQYDSTQKKLVINYLDFQKSNQEAASLCKGKLLFSYRK